MQSGRRLYQILKSTNQIATTITYYLGLVTNLHVKNETTSKMNFMKVNNAYCLKWGDIVIENQTKRMMTSLEGVQKFVE